MCVTVVIDQIFHLCPLVLPCGLLVIDTSQIKFESI
jgi:hypothetical protein